jgi:hypothetical protein
MMRDAMARVYVWLAGLLLVAVIAQFYFAGVGIFTFPGSPKDEVPKEEFALHSVNGLFVIPLLALLAVIVAALARAPGRLIAQTSALIVLPWMQIVIFAVNHAIFGEIADAHPGARWFVSLHVINALLIMSTSIIVLRQSVALRRRVTGGGGAAGVESGAARQPTAV